MGATPDQFPDENSPGSLAEWCAEIERDHGALVAPIAALSPVPELLAAAWLMLRATIVAPGLVDRTTKEAVAAAVAHANSCWYCEELHVTVLESLNERRPADSEITSLADHRIRRITAWARQPAAERPFDDRHVPELAGTVVVSHYLNRITAVLAGPASDVSDPTRFASVARRTRDAPGAGTYTAPDAPLPAGFGWAAEQPAVAAAFVRATAAAEASAAHAVPESVRAVVRAKVSEWQGETPGPDEEWLSGWLGRLPGDDRSTGRLALLTAIAPAQVDPLLVATCREGIGERSLVELAGWASFVAARRVGEWLAPVPPATDSAQDPHRVLPFRTTGTARRRPTTRGRRRTGV